MSTKKAIKKLAKKLGAKRFKTWEDAIFAGAVSRPTEKGWCMLLTDILVEEWKPSYYDIALNGYTCVQINHSVRPHIP